MAGWTNKGKYKVLGYSFVNITVPTNYYVALFTNATPPTADINTFSELTQINAGNGYATGGYSLTPGDTDFDVHTEDDANDRGLVQIKDIVWTATGNLPNGGDGARWACLTDDNATEASREIYIYWDLVSDRSITDTQTLTLQDCEIRINES